MAMTPPDDADEDERTLVRPAAARAAGAMAPTAANTLPATAESVAPLLSAAPRRASTAPGHTLPIGTRLRDYEITGLIGEGGFGIVYLAWDHSLQRRVAMKEYMPASMVSRVAGSSAIVIKSGRHLDTFKAGLKSFVNEARLLARFDHPSLVKVYRFWEENGTAYMVMPFYEGPTLNAALAELGHVPSEAELRAWLDPLLDALTVMHAAQCFHRDIAPDNILLTASGPLLLDFGAARRVIGDMTHALTVVLKPGYAPIEQYGDVASMAQGAWTDLYALACVVYYAITGKTPMSSVERLMDDQLEPIARLAAGRYSAAFLGAIDAALAVRPQDRPQDEARFRALLDADLPALAPATPHAPATIREAWLPGTELLAYSTVPGTLTPVLATQLLTRPPAEPAPGDEAARPAATELANPAPTTTHSVPAAPRSAALAAGAGATRSRMPLTIVALVLGGLALAIVAFWTLQPRERIGADAGTATASAIPASTASGAAMARTATASVVSGPAAVVTELARPSVAVSSAPPSAVPPMNPSASAAIVEAELPVPVPRETTTPSSTRSVAANPVRGRREAAPARLEAPAEARAETPRRAATGAHCSDILQKASLEPLTAEEAAYLKRECR